MELNGEEGFSADVQLDVECGTLSLEEEVRYQQATVQGHRIGSMRKDDLTVYVLEGKLCTPGGVLLSAEESGLVGRLELLQALRQICLYGDFACVSTGEDGWLYTLTLDEEAIDAVVRAAEPDLENLPVDFRSGSVQIEVRDAAIAELECSCTGALNALEQEIPAEVSVRMAFASDRGLEVPDAVVTRLTEDGEDGP